MKGATDAGASCEEGDLWEGDALADAEASSWEGTGRLLVGDAVWIGTGPVRNRTKAQITTH